MSTQPAAPGPSADTGASAPHGHGAGVVALALAAVGIVFGDIGTSPLYTIQECFGEHGVAATRDNVLGVISQVVWSVTLVVTVKYLAFVMRADNRGEGGILALLALVPERIRAPAAGGLGAVTLLVLTGAALLFGDGIITPAISVLSAMEGLGVATHSLDRAVVPLTVAILAALFAIQRRGTARIGRLFGPVMVLWFTVIALLGASHVARAPGVLEALSPHHAARFLLHHGFHGFKMLGSVVLAVTGGEALYADMGHFGRRPIRLAWLALVFPALLCCYLGQGALLLAHPESAAQPFFGMVPRGPAVYALVAVAAPATVIASQALISGVFSLTQQAIQLGYFPRVEVRHTSGEAEGQIYVPALNWVLAVACILLVLAFQHSSRLAAAFGLAVSGTMAITSVVFYVVARHTWGWAPWKSAALLACFLALDLPFFGANLLKFADGGYLPLAVGAVFLAVMVAWRWGRDALRAYYAERVVGLDAFVASLPARGVLRPEGGAVFMASNSAGAPPVLTHYVERVGALHRTVVLLTVTTEHVPTVPDAERVELTEIGQGFFRVIARYGFMDAPDVAAALARAARDPRLAIDPTRVTYFLGRETFLATERGRLGAASEGLFALLSRNARSATAYFGIPPRQVVEIGTQIDL
ncbi:MAG: KUP/HAK/KT family potassium transporter [Polyangiales bacterium]